MGGICLDSTNPRAVIDAIKTGRMWRNMAVRAGAGYIDGAVSAWPASAFTELRATGVRVIEITVTGARGADLADIEKEDMDPAKGAAWAADEHASGRLPGLYCNRDNKSAVLTECSARGLSPGREFVLAVATLDGTFTDTGGADLRSEPGVVLVQAFNSVMTGIDADASVITEAGNDWLNIPPLWQEAALAQARTLFDLLRAHL